MFKVLENGTAPTRATKHSAAVDLYAGEDVIIGAGETAIVRLGVVIDIETFWKKAGFFTKLFNLFSLDFFMKRHKLALEPRSSLRAKGLISGTGIIDLDYKDEIKLIVHNSIGVVFAEERDDGSLSVFSRTASRNKIVEYYQIKKGDRIAQILLKRHETYLLGIESETERTGGLGSTGK